MSQVSRYHPLLVALHWLLAVLVPTALALGAWVMAKIPNDSPMKAEALRGHMAGGLLILTLMVLRLVVRSRTNVPRSASTGSPWFDRLARLSHLALYAGVIGMAAVGLALAAQSDTIGILIGEPARIPADFWVYNLRGVHYAISRLLLLLIALHVTGALYHVLIRKDGLLRRMWFGIRTSKQQAVRRES
jgi:cytochrome b561